MKRLSLALGIGLAGGIAIFIPVARESSLPFVTPPESPIRVLFVGDMMLDRNVARTAEAEGAEALFATSTRALFADADLRVGNLEGTVTGNPSIARRNNKILRFTFSPALTKAVLQGLNINAVSLANNHALDFGPEGYAQTRAALDKDGVAAFGHPYNNLAYLSTKVEQNGKTLCLVGYNALFVASTAPAVDEIGRLRPECWRVVVLAHWGEEYQPLANAAQKTAAHAFVDAGADLVVGAHPHVVQNVEVYKDKAIFYSLGNFMFDQNFSWETTHGLALRADFYEDKTGFVLTPISITEQHASVGTSTLAGFTLP